MWFADLTTAQGTVSRTLNFGCELLDARKFVKVGSPAHNARSVHVQCPNEGRWIWRNVSLSWKKDRANLTLKRTTPVDVILSTTSQFFEALALCVGLSLIG